MQPVNSPYPFHYISLPSVSRLAYIDEGLGETTLLFIHGLSTYGLSWKKNIEFLKERYRCIAIDLPGNGLSSREDQPYGISFFSQVIREFTEKMKLGRLCIVGHSMGGQVAIHTITEYPGMAQQLILCAPAGFEIFTPTEKSLYLTTIQFLGFFSSEENSLRKVIQNSFYHYTAQADDMIRDLVDLLHRFPLPHYRKMTERCIKGMLEEPVFDRLGSIRQPCLVLFGERDALIPNRLLHPVTTADIARQGAAAIPDARLELIPGAGHFVHWEKAAQVNELISDFLS